jgi:hypothetical protein
VCWRGRFASPDCLYHHGKTVTLDAQQIQQFRISTMKQRPAYLRLHALALPLQLLPSQLALLVAAEI